MPATQFMAYKDFFPSIKALMVKGGNWQKAGNTVYSAWGRAHSDVELTVAEVFKGITLTNHGESRISNCRKYDLTGYARLVTAFSNNVCIFLFAGDHDATDAWLEANKGLDFIARETGGARQVSPVFVSDLAPGKHGTIKSETDWLQAEPVLHLLPATAKQKLLSGISDDLVEILSRIESHTDEQEVLDAAGFIEDARQADAVLDVILALRAGNVATAMTRVDLYAFEAKKVSELTAPEIQTVVSSETTVLAQDVDPVLLDHFVRTASFRDWMLYLHPAQREIVNRDLAGPARLAGVSGSGKTSVIIHRAIRLARENPTSKVLVLTLNHALARLILELIHEGVGNAVKLQNLKVTSVFALCVEKLHKLEPMRKDYYGIRTVAPNKFVESEHIDDIWEEYFKCGANNPEAEVMFEVVRTLLVRGVFPQEYLRQELNYIRSAFSASERPQYLEMDRVGRAFPLDKHYRDNVLKGLEGWERKMAAVGAIDDLGVVDSLYRHLDELKPEFDYVLVDEVQDLGTLELKIIRALAKRGKNDLFLAGDAAQAVHTKYSDVKSADIDLPPARWIHLTQNYRNSRQILSAAYSVLRTHAGEMPTGSPDLQILVPEYANFSSAKPLLLATATVEAELALAIGYTRAADSAAHDRKACIAICGYTQKRVEELGFALKIAVLSDSTDLSGARLFLSDLEQTKGFEFDLMVIINCSDGVIPNPQLPPRESFRELCKLYVALTRAKRELVVSYSGRMSSFLVGSEEQFSPGTWVEHEVTPAAIGELHLPSNAVDPTVVDEWAVRGTDFLRQRDAVGLSTIAQDAILACVTGRPLSRREAGRMKEREWRDFRSFFDRLSGDPRARVNVVSNEAWDELSARFEFRAGAPSEAIAPKSISNKSMSAPRVLHRYEGVRDYRLQDMSAHTIATLLALQGKKSVQELQVGEPMNKHALEFLVPAGRILHWMNNGWLRPLRNSRDRVALTKEGWDECRTRVSISVVTNPGSESVTPSSVEALREMIVTGAKQRGDGPFETRMFSDR